MNKNHRGILAHKSLEVFGAQNYKVGDFTMPNDTSVYLHLEKRKNIYEPFDLVRHNNHLSFPAPHTKPIKKFTPQNEGFWTLGSGMCN
jgi:hypothetical protein